MNRSKGKLIKWDDAKAFGFILPNGSKSAIFIHKNSFLNRKRTPQINDVITYSIGKDKSGRYCAVDATYSGEKLKVKGEGKVNKFSLYLAFVFLISMIAMVFMTDLPLVFGYWYLASSLLAFILYAFDKSKAKRNRHSDKAVQRTPESTLHFISLIGGWPGAAFAQQFLRHKSKKVSFRNGYWLTVLVNIAALLWLLSPQGQKMLPALFNM